MYLAQRLQRMIGLGAKPMLPQFFSGSAGLQRTKLTLESNPILSGDCSLVERFMEVGETKFFQKGDAIIEQNGLDNEVYFLLSGAVDIVVGSKKRSIREAPNQIGEMAAISPGSKRAATVIARSAEVAALKVSGNVFNEIWSSDAKFKGRLQQELSARHRESLVATLIAKENNSLVWFSISLGAGLLVSLISMFLLSSSSWTSEAKLLVAAGLGGISFLLTLLHNPAFFWRRSFGLVLIVMFGTYAVDSFLSFEVSQGFGSLQITLSRGNGIEDWQAALVKAASFVIVLGICAFMERREAEN